MQEKEAAACYNCCFVRWLICQIFLQLMITFGVPIYFNLCRENNTVHCSSGVISARQLHQSILAVFLQIETIFFFTKAIIIVNPRGFATIYSPYDIDKWLVISKSWTWPWICNLIKSLPSSLHRPYCHVVTKADKTITTDILFIIAAE